LRRIGQGWVPSISVALILEYEAVGKREAQRLKIPESTVEAIIRAFCFVAARPTFISGYDRSCRTPETNSFLNWR